MTAEATFEAIYKDRDLWVPAFDVKIGGKKVSNKDIIGVRYTDVIDQIDSFELTVNNWDPTTKDFKYTGAASGKDTDGARLFDPGQTIELWMGYTPNPLRLMLTGIITSIAPSFPSSGQPTVKVSGQNILRKLLTKQETRHYESKSDSAIAESIGEKAKMKLGNYEVTIETHPASKAAETVHAHVLQDSQYDLLFLLQRAHRNGYDVVLKYKNGDETKPILYFGPSTADVKPRYQLEWGRSLIQFQPTLSTTRQVSKVTVRYWDGRKGEVGEVTATRKDVATKGLRDKKTLDRIESGFREREDLICDQPFRDKGAATAFAEDRLDKLAKNLVRGKGSTFGTPDLRAGSVVEILGLGVTFTGRYFIESTTHTLGTSGYVTEFDARLEEANQR